MVEEITFEARTLKELKAFIASGVDAKGKRIKVWLFNWFGLKTLFDLFMEHCEDDMRLIRRSDGRIVRCAWNVKVHIETPTRRLCEVKREYARNPVLWWFFWWMLWLFAKPSVLIKKQDFAISETRKRSETPEAAALRGVWEEMGILIPPDELKPLTLLTPLAPGDPTRESRVYMDVLSLNTTECFIWNTKEAFWETSDYLRDISKNGLIITDHNVLIYLKWFDKAAPGDSNDVWKMINAAKERPPVSKAEIDALLQPE